MKVFVVSVAAVAMLLVRAVAQVSVEVAFDQEQYFANEKLLVAVRITNLSGRTLTLGSDDQWLDFSVEFDDGSVVPQLAPLPVKGEFELPNSSRATRRVNLAECFDMTRVGRYRVTAFVRIAELDMDVVSVREAVNIVRGTTVWEQTFGVPAKAGSPPGPLEIRRYELVQAMNSKSVQLYLRLSDPAGLKVFKVFSLGPLLTFSKPEGRVDRQGSLHVLFQVSARVFTYQVVNPDGDLKIRQSYQYTSSRPKLVMNDQAELIVIGGARIVHESDLPPPPANENGETAASGAADGAAAPAKEPPTSDATASPPSAAGVGSAATTPPAEAKPGTQPETSLPAKPKP